MKYSLVVGTYRGEVLYFPEFGHSEYLLALAIARSQSRSCAWAEVRREEFTCARYTNGSVAEGSPVAAIMDDQLSHRRHIMTLREEFGLPRQEYERTLARPHYDEDEECF